MSARWLHGSVIQMTEIAYQHGAFVPRSEMTVSLENPGFVLGITVSERLRTFNGKLFRIDDHLQDYRGAMLSVRC